MCAKRAGALFTFTLGSRRGLNLKGRSKGGLRGWCSFAGIRLKVKSPLVRNSWHEMLLLELLENHKPHIDLVNRIRDSS